VIAAADRSAVPGEPGAEASDSKLAAPLRWFAGGPGLRLAPEAGPHVDPHPSGQGSRRALWAMDRHCRQVASATRFAVLTRIPKCH